jgi:hypothetical protein
MSHLNVIRDRSGEMNKMDVFRFQGVVWSWSIPVVVIRKKSEDKAGRLFPFCMASACLVYQRRSSSPPS